MYKPIITLLILVQLFTTLDCMKRKEQIDQCIVQCRKDLDICLAASILLFIAIPMQHPSSCKIQLFASFKKTFASIIANTLKRKWRIGDCELEFK
ncbi:hypothetical protein CSKR_200598 [Clonorchis sinensis]|uniref:Saposin B-type domain-containing protein n=1 Tax=Clonorchis sinensis TaxID=79923 RepID=A0A8T1MEJ8_CLOSI|nr:hypothetical protein CSKR_200598 [Clonorchis sinensis]